MHLIYITLQKQHINKEENYIIPDGRPGDSDYKHAQIYEDFDHVEYEETGKDIHEKYLQLAVRLEKEMLG
jgi:hemerythrin-like domain-containing protein